MTEIEQKALALVNEVLAENGMNNTPHTRLPTAVSNLVLLRAIEQHEAFKRDVSGAVKKHFMWASNVNVPQELQRFVITKPDPLVEAVNEAWGWRNPHKDVVDQLCAALAKRGLEVREIEG